MNKLFVFQFFFLNQSWTFLSIQDRIVRIHAWVICNKYSR